MGAPATDARSTPTWAVWRIDDTGNTFVVRTGLLRTEADRLVEEYTARGHKQTYWVEADAEPGRHPSVWTVDHEFEQPVRHLNQALSGGSFVANLTLRLAPDLDKPGVEFVSAVPDPDAAYYVPFVEEGVRAFVSRRASEGRPVGHLRVTLTAITIHPVDAEAYRFTQAAEMAMTQAFETVGVPL